MANSTRANFVSLHPYFKVQAGKLEKFKALLPAFSKKTESEQKNLFYDFSVRGDEVFCREGYADAEGLLTHLSNVAKLLEQALTMAEISRLEVHGPAEQLDRLKEPLAHLKPVWFETVSD